MEDIEWVMFFDEFASDFHPTFEKELSRQLYEKGSEGTGIKQFGKYGFQLIVGMKDIHLKVVENKVFAKIDFITPTSWSFSVDIYWSANEENDVLQIHKKDVLVSKVEVNWANNFPLEKILPHIRPYRVDKKSKTGFNFDVEYYYFLLPDISLEFEFLTPLSNQSIIEINTFFKDFTYKWNDQKKGKEIQQISELRKEDENNYSVVTDIGLKNNIRLIAELLKEFSAEFGNLPIVKVTIT
ncbi:MAG: hypothetical protein V4722_00845 [Bacteroidota bacterium]